MSYVKGINIVIGAETTKLDAALNRIDKNSRSLNAELREVNKSLKFDPKNVDLLAQKQKILTERFAETKNRLDALRQAQDGVNKAYQEGTINDDQYRKFQTDIAKTKSQLEGYEKQLKKVSGEHDRFSSVMGQASDKMKDFGDKASGVSKKLAPVSLGAAALLGLVTKQAVEFESAFAGVEKTVDGTAEQMLMLKKGIRDMAKEIPSSTNEISAVAEAAGQLGIETDTILDFTKVMVDMGNSTNLSADVAASTLARFANVTKMSQKDFSRLGSTVVALGNNFATTEAEITDMAMNLGSAGTQVGMSQANIVALATALSSVGLEAQAGGTAFSRVMVDMQLAVETGSASLKDFASVAGMSSEEFSKAFKENATEAILAFVKGLSKSGEQGKSAIKILDDMGIKETRLRDSLLRSANASDVLSKAVGISNKAWNDNSALTEEANKRYATTESKLKIAKNRFNDIAISLGEKLLPHLNKFLEHLGKLIDKFDALPPGMQEFVIKALAITAVTAPTVGAVGKLASGLGSLVGAAGKGAKALGMLKPATDVATTALAGAGTASTVASGGFLASAGGLSGLASGLGAAAAAAAPWVAGAAAIAGGGYLIYKAMQEDAIPAVDLFADHVKLTSTDAAASYGYMAQVMQTETIKISEEAKTRIQSYMDMSKGVQEESINMYSGLIAITDENIVSLQTKSQGLADTIIANVNRQKNENIASYQELFDYTNLATNEQETNILATVTQGSQNRIDEVNRLKERLFTLTEEIKTQGTGITKEQHDEMAGIYERFGELAVKSMADTEAEQGVILNRLKSSSDRVTAEMVGSAITQYNKLHDDTVAKAGERRDKMIGIAESLKGQVSGKDKEMVDGMISNINRQYEATVTSSKKTRTEGIDKLKESYESLYKEIDINTGEILSTGQKFERFWNSQKFEDKRAVIITEHRDEYTERNYRNSRSNRPGYNNGLAYVPFNNFSARLHHGERVLTKEENKQINQQGYLHSMRGKINDLASRITNNVDNSVISNNFTLAGNYVIREEADIQKVVKQLTYEMSKMKRGG